MVLLQGTCQGLAEGIMKVFRLSRRLGGRRTIFGLVGGAAISLLVLALTPHPVPNAHAQSLGHRRIHQEDNDYTAPKQANNDPKDRPIPIANEAVRSVGIPALSKPSQPLAGDRQEDTGVGQVEEVSRAEHQRKDDKKPGSQDKPGSQGLSNLTLSQVDSLAQMADVQRLNVKENELVAKAQETALTALQHGFKLTEGQKKLIERMSPQERKELETRVTKVRARQEKAYLLQLRARKQVRQLQGGGEEIVSTPQMPIRFPGTLKKIHPRNWLPQYRIFLNLTHYPWAKSSSCSNYSIKFRPIDSLPTSALASFPSSGNTWIRYLVEGATGLLTGSLYDDSSLTKKGMYGEGIVYDSGMTILQKSHGYTTGDAMKLSHEERLTKNHMDELNHRGVVIIRNPFKALISHRHLDTGGHTGYAPKAHFLGKGWAEFVTLKIMLWKEFYVDWLTQSAPHDIHITHYENVKKDAVGEMRNILTYLKLRPDEGRLRCLGQHTDGLFKRKPSKNVPLDFNPFTQELKDLVYAAVEELDGVLKQKGKPGLPLDLYEFYDPHEASVARYLRLQRSERKVS